jgi:hypothetical protein
MARVFISHAHSDESMARKLAELLGDALGLSPADFFPSSQQGHGGRLRRTSGRTPALVVLLTPHAAASPWVWLVPEPPRQSRQAPLISVPSTLHAARRASRRPAACGWTTTANA